MTTLVPASTATPDGILRVPELVPGAAAGPWDGKVFPYVPSLERVAAASVDYHREFDLDLDPVTYQVLRWRLWNVNLEHDDTIRRVCGTSIVCYALDYNTSLLTENGDPVLGGPSLQRFVGQADLTVKYILENRSKNPGIEPGDVFILNDPYIACSHQLDVNACMPVFWEDKLFAWVQDAAHQLDMGGMQPGSFCYQARDMFDEPVPWPPIKLVRRGQVQQDVLAAFMRQGRMPEAIALNLRSQIAGLEAAAKRLTDLLREYGAPAVKGAMRLMIRDTSRGLSERLLRIPDGEWQETIYLGATPDRAVRPLRTTVRKEGDILTFSNAGTAEQIAIGNGTYCGFRGAAISCVQTLLAWDQMYCPAGVLNHLRFDPTPGTATIATYPAAVTVVYGVNLAIGMTGQVVSKMLLCGPEDLRERAIATGGLANAGYCLAWGLDEAGNLRFAPALEAVIGALGASPGRDGVDTGGAWEWPRTESGNVEEAEASAPILYLYRREQENSGGPGRWRGGNGVEMAYAGHKVREMFFLALGNDPGVNNAIGLSGGLPGHSGNWLGKADTPIRAAFAAGRLPGSRDEVEGTIGELGRLSTYSDTPLELGSNGVAIGEYCAGGGYGDPLARDPEMVAADLVAGAITRSAAESDYGVAVSDDGVVDAAATTATRMRQKSERLTAARLPHGSPAARAAAGAELRAVTDGVSIVAHDGSLAWCCSECRTVLNGADANFRDGCAVLQRRPYDVDPIRYPDPDLFVDADLVLRQFLCPSCGQLLATDFCLADDAPAWDIKIDLDTLELGR